MILCVCVHVKKIQKDHTLPWNDIIIGVTDGLLCMFWHDIRLKLLNITWKQGNALSKASDYPSCTALPSV